jgi:hypothetical protein
MVEGIDHLSQFRDATDYRRFSSLLEQVDSASLTDWGEIVRFASIRWQEWEVQWLYSSAASPDLEAAEQRQGWRRIHEGCVALLVERIPDIGGPLEDEASYQGLSLGIKRGLAMRGPIARRWWGFVSHVAIFMGKRLGFSTLGRLLYSSAMFPAGTVGRAEAMRREP